MKISKLIEPLITVEIFDNSNYLVLIFFFFFFHSDFLTAYLILVLLRHFKAKHHLLDVGKLIANTIYYWPKANQLNFFLTFNNVGIRSQTPILKKRVYLFRTMYFQCKMKNLQGKPKIKNRKVDQIFFFFFLDD